MSKNDKEVSIDIIKLESQITTLDMIDIYNLITVLPPFARICEIEDENMMTFIDLIRHLQKYPNLSVFKEILLNFVLKDDKYIPTIVIDISAAGTQPWQYYVSPKVPPNTIRTTLPFPKKVYVETINGNVSLWIPQNFPIDIKMINNININQLNSMYLTTKFYNIKRNLRSLYPNNCNNYRTIIPPYKQPTSTLNNIYESFKNIVNEYFPNTLPLSILNNINFFSLLDHRLIQLLSLYLIDSDTNDSYLLVLKKDYQTSKRKYVNAIIKYKEELKNEIIKSIIKKFFPTTYVEKIKEYSLKLYVPYYDIFKILSENGKQLVIKEYDQYEAFQKSIINNRCPHIPLLNKFRREKSIKEKMKIYPLLRKYITNIDNKKSFHKCNKCGFNLICSHITSEMENIFNNGSEMERRAILDSYRDTVTATKHEDFCKYCQEKLFSSTWEDILTESYRLLYYDIFKYLWSQTLNIFPLLILRPTANIFDFSGFIVYGILPIMINSKITEVSHELNVYIRTNELSPEFKGIIILYIYAYILNMIRINISHPKEKYVQIRFKHLEGESKNISAYVKTVLQNLNTLHRSVFNQLTALPVDTILLAIYSEIGNSNALLIMKQLNNISMVIFSQIVKNTVFKYAFWIANVTLPEVNMSTSILTIIDYETIVEKILGAKIRDIVNGTYKNRYLDVYQPDVNDKSILEYKKIIKKNTLTIEELFKIMKGRTLYNFIIYMKIFTKNSIEKEEEESAVEEYINEVSKNSRKIQNTANFLYKIITETMESTKKWKPQQYTNDPNITCIYNENGIPHKWSLAIYSDGAELRKTEQIKKYATIVDYKDIRSGILRSQTNKLNVEKTRKGYQKQIKIKVFFSFYRVRCPEDGIHIFRENEICIKCGLKEGTEEGDYHNKYYDKFLDDTKDAGGEASVFKESGLDIAFPFTKRKWIPNNNSLTTLAKLSNISLASIESIGAMEYRTVEEVKLGKKRPPYPTVRYDPQLSLSLSHYYSVVGLYNYIKYGELKKDLVEVLGKSKDEVVNKKADMPINLYIPYNETIRTTFNDNTINYENKYKCIIQMTCDFILKIYDLKGVATKIAIYMINDIINKGYLTCRSSVNFDRTLLQNINSVVSDLKDKVQLDIDDGGIEDNYMKDGGLHFDDVQISDNS